MRQSLLDLRDFILDLLRAFLIAVVIIVPIRYFLVQPFYVKGASMEPTFLDREYLLIDEISYRFRIPSRGDVIVFRYPLDPSQFYIKRVIGLPGETVRISGGRVTIVNAEYPNGYKLTEPYLASSVITAGDLTVPVLPGQYFVMGDNRTSSRDSRAFGTVPAFDVTGRVWVRVLPITRWTVFHSGVLIPAESNGSLSLTNSLPVLFTFLF